jgi:hypothetical protein
MQARDSLPRNSKALRKKLFEACHCNWALWECAYLLHTSVLLCISAAALMTSFVFCTTPRVSCQVLGCSAAGLSHPAAMLLLCSMWNVPQDAVIRCCIQRPLLLGCFSAMTMSSSVAEIMCVYNVCLQCVPDTRSGCVEG